MLRVRVHLSVAGFVFENTGSGGLLVYTSPTGSGSVLVYTSPTGVVFGFCTLHRLRLLPLRLLLLLLLLLLRRLLLLLLLRLRLMCCC